MECAICRKQLTIDTIVNTNCNHPQCKACFWEWTKRSYKCCICRRHILENPEEHAAHYTLDLLTQLCNDQVDRLTSLEEKYDIKKTRIFGLRDEIDTLKKMKKVLDTDVSKMEKKYYRTLKRHKLTNRIDGIERRLLASRIEFHTAEAKLIELEKKIINRTETYKLLLDTYNGQYHVLKYIEQQQNRTLKETETRAKINFEKVINEITHNT